MRPTALALVLALATPASAEVPRVLADTAPVHSLVAMVMGDLGTPELIVPPGTSPHDASLSPSEAQALTEAGLIVWTGPQLLPWLGEALTSLAEDAPTLALLESDGWEPLPLREGADLHQHGEEGHVHVAHHDVAHDPHAWLDPDVASVWLSNIAEAMAKADPDNAGTYARNASEAADRIGAEAAEIEAQLAPLSGRGYAVGHDAYQYFERAIGLPANWAVRDAAGLDPAPGDVSALREAVVAGDVTCLLLDAETDPSWAETLGEGATLRTATVDPDGVTLEPGPDLYPTLLRNLGTALAECLGG
jgi:zinc transport system substrate-binding protein